MDIARAPMLDTCCEHRCLKEENGRWHSLECLESGSVLFECKDGPYAPLTKEKILEK